ncbi:MAG: 4Fe-4S binding protein [Spirochaetales bacterium]|nr:4Fe-4S binding protein [Spirochaetales bacterium]
MKKQTSWEELSLKVILATYIILCIIIASLNFGYAPSASENTRAIIMKIWQIYENEFKTLMIITASLLTLRIEKRRGRIGMRKRNLIGFIISALIIHILLSKLLRNPDLYFLAMPVPWTSTGWKLMVPETEYYHHVFNLWGVGGITASLIFFLGINLTAFTGTLFFGRRWFCSSICLFNGFASEIFSPIFPLIGKRKKASPGLLKFFSILGWILLSAGIVLTIFWILRSKGIQFKEGTHTLFDNLELVKYMSLELLMAMFFWVVFTGRGYCHYCPAGKILGMIGKLSDQKINTNLTNCIACGKCNTVCPMSIDIKTRAALGNPVTNNRCVGCGHCVDACPTETLKYTTRFLSHRNSIP